MGNVELLARERDALTVQSNFHLYWARPGNESVIYSGARRDLLRPREDGFGIAQRDVILDYADIELPTLGLLF